MSNYTKGPWEVKHSASNPAFNVIGTVLGGKYKIARCPYLVHESKALENINTQEKNEAQANAQLIAAAPDLLEALQLFVKIINRSPAAMSHYCEAIEKAEAAIQKATGEKEKTV